MKPEAVHTKCNLTKKTMLIKVSAVWTQPPTTFHNYKDTELKKPVEGCKLTMLYCSEFKSNRLHCQIFRFLQTPCSGNQATTSTLTNSCDAILLFSWMQSERWVLSQALRANLSFKFWIQLDVMFYLGTWHWMNSSWSYCWIISCQGNGSPFIRFWIRSLWTQIVGVLGPKIKKIWLPKFAQEGNWIGRQCQIKNSTSNKIEFPSCLYQTSLGSQGRISCLYKFSCQHGTNSHMSIPTHRTSVLSRWEVIYKSKLLFTLVFCLASIISASWLIPVNFLLFICDSWSSGQALQQLV